MNNIELTIFDCDGVLVDSELVAANIETDLLRQAGYEIATEQFIERFSGMSWREILLAVEAQTGLKLLHRLLDKTEAALDARLALEARAIDGAALALQALPYPRCVCSNTKKDRLDMMLNKVRLASFFEPHVFSAKDLGDGRSKPKPDIFLYGAAELGIVPSRAIVIEDSVHGVTAARSAGMRAIGFTGGSHSYTGHARKLTDAGAHLTISHMADLTNAIETLATQT